MDMTDINDLRKELSELEREVRKTSEEIEKTSERIDALINFFVFFFYGVWIGLVWGILI